MLTNSRKLPTAIVMLSETVFTSADNDDASPPAAADSASNVDDATPTVVVDVVVVAVVVVGDDDCVAAAVLVVVVGRGRLVVVSKSLRDVSRVPCASNDVRLSQSSSWW